MNWGTKIGLTYGMFAALIISMVVFCMRQTDIHLVSKEYYKEEIAYQEQIDQLQNARHRRERPLFRYEPRVQSVQLEIPNAAADLSGSILFFRPADARKDRQVAMHLQNDQQTVSVSDLDRGLWKVKIRWKEGEKEYLEEQTLILP